MKFFLTLFAALTLVGCAGTQQNQEVNQEVKQNADNKPTNAVTAPAAANKQDAANSSKPEASPVKKGEISNIQKKGDQVTFNHTVTNDQGLIVVSLLTADCQTNHYKVTFRSMATKDTVIRKDETVVENNNPTEDAVRDIQTACKQK